MIEAIKKGFSVASKNLKLVLIVYGVGIVFGLISLPFIRRMGAAAPGIAPVIPGGGFLIIIILSVLVQIFVMGGVLGSVQEAIKKGAANIAEFVTFGKKYYLRLLLSGLLGFVIAAVYGFIFAALVGGMAAGETVIKIILGLLLAIYILFGITLTVMLVFWPYALVSEDIGVIAGLKKSIEIARKPIVNLFKILALVVIMVLVAFLVNLAISLPQVLLRKVVILANLYRIFIVGAVGAYLNIALVSVLMAYYFTLKGGSQTAAAQEGTSTEIPNL